MLATVLLIELLKEFREVWRQTLRIDRNCFNVAARSWAGYIEDDAIEDDGLRGLEALGNTLQFVDIASYGCFLVIRLRRIGNPYGCMGNES